MQELLRNLLIYVLFKFMNFVHSFVNYAIFRELCDRMRFEVDCAKSHHRVISEGLNYLTICNIPEISFNVTQQFPQIVDLVIHYKINSNRTFQMLRVKVHV